MEVEAPAVKAGEPLVPAANVRKLFRQLGKSSRSATAKDAGASDTSREESDDESGDATAKPTEAPPSWRARFAARSRLASRHKSACEAAAAAHPQAASHNAAARDAALAELRAVLVPEFAKGSQWEEIVEAMARCSVACVARPEAGVA